MLSKVHNIGGKDLHPRGFLTFVLHPAIILLLIIAMATPVACYTYSGADGNGYYYSSRVCFGAYVGCNSGFNCYALRAYGGLLQLCFWGTIATAIFAVLNAISQPPAGPIAFKSSILTILLAVQALFMLVAAGWGFLAVITSSFSVSISASPFFAALACPVSIACVVLSKKAAPGPNDDDADDYAMLPPPRPSYESSTV